jgi:ribose-phosphate pyrophosphokinase
VKLFTLEASRPLGQRIARELGVELASHEERAFEDSEFKVRSLESVRGEEVFVCQSLAGDAAQSANDKLCRLLFFVGALKEAGAATVSAVVPYLAYARKDRRTKSRDPVTTRYVAAMFEAVGTDAVLVMDVHNPAAFENAFRCLKEHVEAAPLFVEHFTRTLGEPGKLVVLSPDAGGVKRARRFLELLSAEAGWSAELAFVEKQRSEGRVTGEAFAGDVRDATVIVIDDIISSGTTIARAARACRDKGARAVHAAATHGLFGDGAAAALGGAELASVVVTDSIGEPAARCPSLGDRLVVLDSAPSLAGAIDRLGRGG